MQTNCMEILKNLQKEYLRPEAVEQIINNSDLLTPETKKGLCSLINKCIQKKFNYKTKNLLWRLASHRNYIGNFIVLYTDILKQAEKDELITNDDYSQLKNKIRDFAYSNKQI